MTCSKLPPSDCFHFIYYIFNILKYIKHFSKAFLLILYFLIYHLAFSAQAAVWRLVFYASVSVQVNKLNQEH